MKKQNNTIFLDGDGLLPDGHALEVKSRAEQAAKLGLSRSKLVRAGSYRYVPHRPGSSKSPVRMRKKKPESKQLKELEEKPRQDTPIADEKVPSPHNEHGVSMFDSFSC